MFNIFSCELVIRNVFYLFSEHENNEDFSASSVCCVVKVFSIHRQPIFVDKTRND